MNFTGLDVCSQQTNLTENDLSPSLHSVPLSVLVYGPLVYVALPFAAKKVEGMFKQLKSNASFWGSQAQAKLNQYSSVKKATELTGNVLKITGKVAFNGIRVLDELVDVGNFGGTKNPLTSIEKSRERIERYHKPLLDCCNFLADQVAEIYLQNVDEIKAKVKDAINDYSPNPTTDLALNPFANFEFAFFENVAHAVEWFLNFSQDLIVQTIKANVLHLLANLVEAAFDSAHPFADQQRNPFGRLLTVIGSCFTQYEERLEGIKQLPKDQQDHQYHSLFRELSTDLLAKFFPKGAEDIQLFHHTIPVKLFKEPLWEKIKNELPHLLEELYLEMRPLDQEYFNWQHQFEEKAYGLEMGHFIHLPSQLVQDFIRKDKGKWIEGLKPALESWLHQDKKLRKEEAERLSQIFERYMREFILTHDPTLLKIGSFFERYFMERILYNLSQFISNAETTPLPLYLVQHWVQGQPFKIFLDALSGHPSSDQECKQAVQELLAPFGLNKEETFPLPSSLKKQIWPSIRKFQQEKFPSLIGEAIPKWHALSKREENQLEMQLAFDDLSLTDTLYHVTKQWIEQLANVKFSLAQMLNSVLPYPLTTDQQEKIDQQGHTLLEENETLWLLKGAGQECLEALVLQVCVDLFKSYQESDDPSTPFFVWLIQEVIKAYGCLAVEGIPDQELEILQQAIHLKNAIQSAQDSTIAQNHREELASLWPTIQSYFERFLQHVFHIFGYDHPRKLPVLENLQPLLWKHSKAALTTIVFEYTSDFLLPLLERQKLKEQVKVLPESERIQKGCRLLAQDLVAYLLAWMDKNIDYVPNGLIAHFPQIKLTDKAKKTISASLKALTQRQEPAFHPIWQWLEKSVESLLLKVAVELGQMTLHDLQKLQLLAQETREKLLAIEETPEAKNDEEILATFIDQFFDCLGIKTDLFGFPPHLGRALVATIKEKGVRMLLGVYHLDKKIRHYPIEPHAFEAELPTSQVAQTVLAFSRFILDKATNSLTYRVNDNEEMPGITRVYTPFMSWLDQQTEKGYRIAELFKEIIVEQVPTPFLNHLFQFLDGDDSKPYKHQVAEWIQPLLTHQVIKVLIPLLEKERQGQADFDQALLVAILPILTHHFKHLNQASLRKGGLNFANFVAVVGDDLHAAVPIHGTEESQQLQIDFYEKQVDLIFHLIFPQGKEDLIHILPELELSSDQLELIWNAAKSKVAAELPLALHSLFDQDLLIEVYKNLLELIDEKLDQPIKIKNVNPQQLTKEEQEQQAQMNHLIGECVVEMTQFIDLPSGIKKIIGSKKIEQGTVESLGALIRDQCQGELVSQILQKVFSILADKRHIKSTENEKMDDRKKIDDEIKKLEQKVSEKGIAYPFRYLEAWIDHATDIFTHPMIEAIRQALLAIYSFVIGHLVASLLRLLGIEKFVANRLHHLLLHTREKTLSVFSQANLHEDLVYREVEAIEEVLRNQSI